MSRMATNEYIGAKRRAYAGSKPDRRRRILDKVCKTTGDIQTDTVAHCGAEDQPQHEKHFYPECRNHGIIDSSSSISCHRLYHTARTPMAYISRPLGLHAARALSLYCGGYTTTVSIVSVSSS